MNLPIKTFWLMNSSINRILAQRDMRDLTVAMCCQGSEAANDYREKLILEVGTVALVKDGSASVLAANSERDVAGFEELRAMASQM